MAIKDPELLTEADFPVEFGRYTLTGLLGEGGMGRVFTAKLRGSGAFEKEVAVKVVRTSAIRQNPELGANLETEARIGAKLKHTNVVDTYDFALVDDTPMIAMELLKGLTLKEVMDHRVELAPRQVVELALGVAEGLEYAHEFEDGGQGVHLVHRDLKPSNLFVTRSGTVKILDFGIAKASEGYGGQTATGFTKGTFGYMPPEQFEVTQLDGRADLFSLGVILYELVCGERLCVGESLPQLLKAMMRLESIIEADDFEAKIDGLVPGLGPIVRRCLRESPEARYADAGQLVDALRAMLHSLPPAERLGHTVQGILRDRNQLSTAPQPTRVVAPESDEGPQATRVVDLDSKTSEQAAAEKAAAEKAAAEKAAAEKAAAEKAAAEKAAAEKAAAEKAAAEKAAAEKAAAEKAAAEKAAAEKAAAEKAAAEKAAAEKAAAEKAAAEKVAAEKAAAEKAAAEKAAAEKAAAEKAAAEKAAAEKAAAEKVAAEKVAAERAAAEKAAADRAEVAARVADRADVASRVADRADVASRVADRAGVASRVADRAEQTAADNDGIEATASKKNTDPSVPSDKRLTNVIAQSFCNGESVALRRFEYLDVGAAVVLANHKGDLHLQGLASLTVAAASALGKHSHGWLNLGLTSLTADVAAELAKHPGVLTMNRLNSLTVDAAAALAKHSKHSSSLFLDSLSSLTPEVAAELARYPGNLFLNGLVSLKPDVARDLAKHPGHLMLNGLTSLTADVAAELAKHSNSLWLRGLTSLTVDVAAELAKHSSSLFLTGLTNLTPGVAAALASHAGTIEFGNLNKKSKPLLGMQSSPARRYAVYGLLLCSLIGGAVFYFTGDRNGRSTDQPDEAPVVVTPAECLAGTGDLRACRVLARNHRHGEGGVQRDRALAIGIDEVGCSRGLNEACFGWGYGLRTQKKASALDVQKGWTIQFDVCAKVKAWQERKNCKAAARVLKRKY